MEELKPLQFLNKLYSVEELIERRNTYLSLVSETRKFLSDNNKYAVDHFRQYNEMLDREFKEYQKVKVRDFILENISHDEVKAERTYISWVEDVATHHHGAITMKNLHSLLFDYESFVIFNVIE